MEIVSCDRGRRAFLKFPIGTNVADPGIIFLRKVISQLLRRDDALFAEFDAHNFFVRSRPI
jgi:hypothetical protein